MMELKISYPVSDTSVIWGHSTASCLHVCGDTGIDKSVELLVMENITHVIICSAKC